MPRKLLIPNKSLTPGWDRGKQDAKTVQSELQYRTDQETIERWANDLTISPGPWESGTGAGSAELIGQGDNASAQAAVAEGFFTTASGLYSHSEGEDSAAQGEASHAEGFLTVASGFSAHCEGTRTAARGDQSHCEGNQSGATGSVSHAEGSQTQATGGNSHSEGAASVAEGEGSHAGGWNFGSGGSYAYAPGMFSQGGSSTESIPWSPLSNGVNAGVHSVNGRSQYSHVTVSTFTADATPKFMPSASNAVAPTLVIQPTFVAFAAGKVPVSLHFVAYVVARREDAGDYSATSAWKIEGVLSGGGVAPGAYRVVGVITTTLIAQDAGAAGWAVAASVPGSNALNIQVTGEAGASIVWTATIHLHEIG